MSLPLDDPSFDEQQDMDAAIEAAMEDLHYDPSAIRFPSHWDMYNEDRTTIEAFHAATAALILEATTRPFSPDLVADRAYQFVRAIAVLMAHEAREHE